MHRNRGYADGKAQELSIGDPAWRGAKCSSDLPGGLAAQREQIRRAETHSLPQAEHIDPMAHHAYMSRQDKACSISLFSVRICDHLLHGIPGKSRTYYCLLHL